MHISIKPKISVVSRYTSAIHLDTSKITHSVTFKKMY